MMGRRKSSIFVLCGENNGAEYKKLELSIVSVYTNSSVSSYRVNKQTILLQVWSVVSSDKNYECLHTQQHCIGRSKKVNSSSSESLSVSSSTTLLFQHLYQFKC